jgi:hypothetical protein
MPFTPIEKARIIFYLGYSGFEDNGPAMRAINSLDSKEPTMGFIIRELLDKLQDIDRQIHETIPISMATQDGPIQVRAHYTLDHLWRLGRSYVNRLARFTKISVDGDVFSVSSNARDGASFYSGDPAESRFSK